MAKRIALAALAFVVWFAIFFAGKALIVSGIGHNRPFVACFAIVLLVAYAACTRWIERRRPSELAVRRVGLAVIGAIIGVALFAATLAIFAFAGLYHFPGAPVLGPLIGGAIASFAAAVGEEILFRGYIFRWIENGAGTWIAVVISSVLFGLMHLLNRGETSAEVAGIAIGAGVLLSGAYVYSRSLWLPIGIHFGWDIAGGGIFHTPMVTRGPSVFTGGHSGIEASLVAVVLCAIVGIGMLIAAQRGGRTERGLVAARA